jgi:hypothetical protein
VVRQKTLQTKNSIFIHGQLGGELEEKNLQTKFIYTYVHKAVNF